MRKRWGFSLLECVIAVMVLSIGVLGVMSAMGFSVTQQEHAELVPVAAYYAQQIMEDIRANGRHKTVLPPGLPSASSGVNSTTKVAINAAPLDVLFNRISDTNSDGQINSQDAFKNFSRYQRTITMERLSTNASDYRYNLVRVRVTVFWREYTGVDQKNPGNQQSTANSGGRSSVERAFELQAILD